MDLSVIIVNWNSADYLRSCLLSLYRETHGIRFEVIVVDNASFDGSEAMVRSEFPGVLFIQSEKNLGFARANNLGFSKSSGDFVLFLNPDTEVIGNALEGMVACLRAHSSAGAAGARLLNTDGTLQTSCVQSFPTIWNQVLDAELLRRAFPKSSLWGTRALFAGDGQPVRVDAISGACFMAERRTLERVGGFTEDYFMYSDDLDLSYKIKQAGRDVLYLNDCRVTHHGGKSSVQREDHFADVLQRESLLQFFRKAHGAAYSSVYRATTAGIALLRVGLLLCISPFGGFGLQGKAPRTALRKWSKIFRWAVGLENLPGIAGSRTSL